MVCAWSIEVYRRSPPPLSLSPALCSEPTAAPLLLAGARAAPPGDGPPGAGPSGGGTFPSWGVRTVGSLKMGLSAQLRERSCSRRTEASVWKIERAEGCAPKTCKKMFFSVSP